MKNSSISAIKTSLIYHLLILLVFSPFFSLAQPELEVGGIWNKVDYNGEYQDFKIPANFHGKIHLRMTGGDGGWGKAKPEDCGGKGGSGAQVDQVLIVGNRVNEIPAGSILRFIIGGKGENYGTNGGCTECQRAGGGGGGSGLLAKIDGEWVILSVAGGGGGGAAHVDIGICNNQDAGRSASDTPDGLDGNGLTGLDGGTDGGGGQSDGTGGGPYEAGGGGGVFSDAYGGSNGGNGSGKAGWPGGPDGGQEPIGGVGGVDNRPNVAGGFGFGGGGSGAGFNFRGGGGGGYSGGGAGGEEQGGGGGGTYVNDAYTFSSSIYVEGSSFDSQHGDAYVALLWECLVEIESISVVEPENCATQGATATATLDRTLPCATDLTYDLYDISNPDDYKYVDLSLDGVFENVGAGEFAIVVGNVAYGPIDTATFVVNVPGDVTYPTAVCQDITVTLEEDGTYILEPEEIDGGSTDDCGIDRYFLLGEGGIGLSQQTLSCEQVGDADFDVGLAVTDHADQTSICIAKVTVLDGTSPSLPDNMQVAVYLDANGQYSLKQEDISHIVGVDLCDDVVNLNYTIDDESATYTCTDIGQTVTTKLTVFDPAGNTGVGNISITVLDNISPTIVCQDVTIDLSDQGTANINYRDFIVSASDNCLTEEEIINSYSWDEDLLPNPVNCNYIGQNDIVLSSSTDIHGNVLPKCSAILTVRDVSGPEIVCRDTTIYIDQGNAAFTQETLPIASVSDACNNESELSFTWKKTTSFTCADLGSDENFWIEVKDPYNNTSSCIFTVTVADTTLAEVTCGSRDIELNAINDYSYTLRTQDVYTGLTSVCNTIIDHPGTLAFSDDTDLLLDCDDIGSPKTVTLEFTPDDGAPPSSCTTTVSVSESGRPNITCPTGIIDLEATYEDCGARYEYEYTAWDNECPEVEVNITEGLPSGSIFPIGWNSMTIRVWDKSGNTTACSFTVRVAPPSATPTLTCPEDYTVLLTDEACSAIIDTTAIFDQSCVVQNIQNLGPTMGSSFEVGIYTFGFQTRNTETNLSSQCTFTVTVDKANKKPVAVCKDATFVLTNGQIEIDPAELDGGSYDNCYDLNQWVLFDGSFSRRIFRCADLGENDFRLRVYNSIGEWSECDTRVTFVLEEPQCQDITVLLDQEGTATISPEDLLLPDAACTNSYSIQIDQSNFDCSDVGINQVTLTRLSASDTQQCTANVTVTTDDNVGDITPPVAICIPDTTIYVEYNWNLNLAATTLDAGSYDIDRCEINDNFSLALSDDILFCADLGPYEYTLTVTDDSGNSSSCSTTITIADILGPEILHCRDISVELNPDGNYTLTNSDIEEAFQTREVCLSAPLDVSQVQFDFDCTDVGQAIPMTIIGRDSHGNTSECTFTVSVNNTNNEALTAVCQDVVVELIDGSYTNNDLASLLEGGSYGTCDPQLSASTTSFDCSNIGENAVTLTVTNANGNTSTCTSTVWVEDKSAPVALCQNITISLDASGTYTLIPADLDNGSNDECDANLNFTASQIAFDCADIGTQDISLTVADQSNNTSTCQATITVKDEIAPEALCQDVTVQLEDNGQLSITPALIDNGSNDACNIATLALNKSQFDCADVGENTLILTATDENGNTSSCEAKVLLQDDTPPMVLCYQGTVNLNADGVVQITPNSIEVDKYDACGIASLEVSPSSFNCNQVGENQVTITAMDNNGNTSTCQGIITIRDNTAPTARCQDVSIQLGEDGTATLGPQQVDNGSFDNCSIGQIYTLPYQFDCDDIGPNVVRLWVEDREENVSFCEATVTVQDLAAPTISCQDLTIQLDATGNASISHTDIGSGADACGTSSLSLDKTDFSCDEVGENTVTLSATDENNNTGSCQATVTVKDEVAPEMLCQDVSVQLDENGQASITANDINNGSSDACGVANLSIDISSFNCSNIGDNTITLTATDIHGNANNCQATVTVSEEIEPTAICQDITVQLDENGLANISVSDINNGSSDACGLANLSIDISSFDCSNIGENTITLTATDIHGNTSSCQAAVAVIDEVAPTAICQDATVQLDENGQGNITVDEIDNGSNDACGLSNLSIDISSFDCSNIGENTITLTATDIHGNASDCQANLIVSDEIEPTALCQDITVQLNENGQASITATAIDNGSSDACGISEMSLDQSNFDCTQVGDQTVSLSVTDNNGSTSSCQATVTIADEVASQVLCGDYTVQLDENGLANISVNDIDNGTSDACGLTNLSIDISAFDCSNVGDNTVTITATDIHGNTSSCQATVSVLDEVAPIALCQNITAQLDENGQASITVNDINNGSSDACGLANLSIDLNRFDCSHIGDNTTTLTATDIHGNASSCQATVSVLDEVAPTALCQNITVQLDENGLASISEAAIDNSSSDACGIASMNLDQNSFSCEQAGDNTVILTLTDNNGNLNTCEAIVTVVDEIKPSLTCPEDMVVNTDQGECGAYVTLPKAAPADNCGIKNLKSRYRSLDEAGNPVGSWSAWANDQSGFFELGAYQIQWRTKDHANNKRFCSFTLNVIDEEAPEVSCKDLIINFNGEETIAISPASIFDETASFDACGAVNFVSQSLADVSCANVGETFGVEVVGVDPNGNTSSCTAIVSVEGMPCGFEATDVDCTDGASANYDPEGESFTLTANDCSGYPQGEYSIVKTELCGDGEIMAHIASLGGDGRAGLIMMESADPEARFVNIIKDLTPRVRTEYRNSFGGGLAYRSKNRSGVDWLRIVREGNTFKTYTSNNGNYWRRAHTIRFGTFQECIEVGLIVYTKNASTPITTVFDQVSVTGENNDAFTPVDDAPIKDNQEAVEQGVSKSLQSNIQLDVAPNPFADQAQIEFTLPNASDVTLEVYNLHGQRVQSLENARLDAGTHRYEWNGQNSQGESLPTGIYMLRLRADKKWMTTKVSLINK